MSDLARVRGGQGLVQALWGDIERLTKGLEVMQIRVIESDDELWKEIDDLKRILYEDRGSDSLVTRLRLTQERERDWEQAKSHLGNLEADMHQLQYIVSGSSGLCDWRQKLSKRFWSWIVSLSMAFAVGGGAALVHMIQRVDTLHAQVVTLEMRLPPPSLAQPGVKP